MIRALFFDIDGTLISSKTGKPTPTLAPALAALRQKGYKLFVATGRSQMEIMEAHLLEGLFFDAYVTMNGQLCFDADWNPICSTPIDPQDVAEVVRLSREIPFPCVFVEAEDIYISDYTEEVLATYREIYTKPPRIEDIDRALTHRVYKIVPYLREAQQALLLERLPHCDYTRWHPRAIDLLPKGRSKSSGILEVLALFGIDLSEVAAFGDGRNDIEMVEAAAIGVAVASGDEELKRRADYITASPEEGGMEQALAHLGLL